MKKIVKNIIACLDSIMSAIRKKDLPLKDMLLLEDKLYECILELKKLQLQRSHKTRYDVKLIKNLLIKTYIDGNCSICDTCAHKEEGILCEYATRSECSDDLENYIPNETMINGGE